MNGLDEIVLAIKQKAERQSADIKAATKEKAAGIEREAGAAAKAEGERIAREAERKCRQINETALSAAEACKARGILKFKAKTVRDVIDGIILSLEGLGDNEYFEVLEKLIYSNFHKGEEGIIHFGKKDTERLPAGFIDKVNKTLEKDGARLTAGDATNIKNGFILSYGDIEENCSFEAIISSKQDILKDKIAQILFAN